MKLGNTFNRKFCGMPPSFQIADEVYYITRGRLSSSACQPLTIDEWLNTITSDKEIMLDEIYQWENIHQGTIELWKEQGRANWIKAPGDKPEWFHFCKARIDYIHDHVFRSGRHIDRYQKIKQDLPDNPTLEAWCDYVHNDPLLTLDDQGDSPEPGRALWLSRKGVVKYIFRYLPSSIWLHVGLSTETNHHDHKLQRLNLCQRLAKSLSCQVWHGRNEVLYFGSESA